VDDLLMDTLPPPPQIRERLGAVLREADLLRRLLKVSERAEIYRRCLAQIAAGQGQGCAEGADDATS
jgi:hypothetical protein